MVFWWSEAAALALPPLRAGWSSVATSVARVCAMGMEYVSVCEDMRACEQMKVVCMSEWAPDRKLLSRVMIENREYRYAQPRKNTDIVGCQYF